MSLSSIGLEPRLRSLLSPIQSGTQGLIDSARFAMFSQSGRPTDKKKCIVRGAADGSRRLQPSARFTLTNIEDLELGARNCGCGSSRVASECLDQGVIPGLILAGDPSVPGAYGARLNIDYRGGHFIFLPSQSVTGRWQVHDPLCLSGPEYVSPHELKAFLSARIFGDCIGLQLWKRPGEK